MNQSNRIQTEVSICVWFGNTMCVSTWQVDTHMVLPQTKYIMIQTATGPSWLLHHGGNIRGLVGKNSALE